MSKLIEKKNIIHIVVELIAFIGIVFYFNQKNKKINLSIEVLTQRMEEQENIINNHEKIITQLVEFIKKENNRKVSVTTKKPSSNPNSIQKNKKNSEYIIGETEVFTEKVSNIRNFSSESETESDLDAEIVEELGELEIVEEIKVEELGELENVEGIKVEEIKVEEIKVEEIKVEEIKAEEIKEDV